MTARCSQGLQHQATCFPCKSLHSSLVVRPAFGRADLESLQQLRHRAQEGNGGILGRAPAALPSAGARLVTAPLIWWSCTRGTLIWWSWTVDVSEMCHAACVADGFQGGAHRQLRQADAGRRPLCRHRPAEHRWAASTDMTQIPMVLLPAPIMHQAAWNGSASAVKSASTDD